jgi:hypothetical protein
MFTGTNRSINSFFHTCKAHVAISIISYYTVSWMYSLPLLAVFVPKLSPFCSSILRTTRSIQIISNYRFDQLTLIWFLSTFFLPQTSPGTPFETCSRVDLDLSRILLLNSILTVIVVASKWNNFMITFWKNGCPLRLLLMKFDGKSNSIIFHFVTMQN